MFSYKTKEEYINYFRQVLENRTKGQPVLEEYLKKQNDHLNRLMKHLSSENFWQVLPELLGIDAKLNLMIELIKFEDFSAEELLRVVETDYRSYFKELCGYDLQSKTPPSIIFQVA
ncbi:MULTISPECIES: DUF7006 family protein [unclassified Enterococcus]|uniref:DUF7006 family protein n=1 Tax=unclassified Enterococcus TaxID=2608891 RepID=UPI0019068BB9|nr:MULTISPECIES: hypothetical protein [unclassified Enterococcus]MBK0039231.1 hypothetical protein [Enterococcus sp. S52]MBK0071879.1 hypothetical protein [Enterococcus sp. S53]MBK0142471.1 hypothetical protein [Enterococcus sp. S76]MBK0146166.1 hypothetical protein [Enterococcus sp. S77]